MLNLVLFGPPGAGKGTQASFLIENYNLIHLSTGDILREEISNKSTLGLKAKKLMDRGCLVPDEIVIGMIESKLENFRGSNGFIFDGFPRTEKQAIALDLLLKEKDTSISAMIALEVEDKELIERLLNRGIDSGRSDDQNEDIIKNRINEYNVKTTPLKKYYLSQDKLHKINGFGSVEDISKKINSVIQSL